MKTGARLAQFMWWITEHCCILNIYAMASWFQRSFISLWKIYAAMTTRVPIKSAKKYYAAVRLPDIVSREIGLQLAF